MFKFILSSQLRFYRQSYESLNILTLNSYKLYL